MKGCLEGIRVLELGNFISGPYGACLLSDLGAEVIKVENPKGGDPFRGWDLGGDQPNFWAFNRGKKSITLNLQTAEGREVFYALVKKSDIVMENYRPGVTKKLAIDYETLRKLNDRIICCSITGTGPTGPYVHRSRVCRQLERYVFRARSARRPGGEGADRQRPADRRDHGRLCAGVFDRAGDRNPRAWTTSWAVHAAAALANLCVLRLGRFAVRHSSLVAAKILGGAVQSRGTSGVDRRSALQYATEPQEKL